MSFLYFLFIVFLLIVRAPQTKGWEKKQSVQHRCTGTLFSAFTMGKIETSSLTKSSPMLLTCLPDDILTYMAVYLDFHDVSHVNVVFKNAWSCLLQRRRIEWGTGRLQGRIPYALPRRFPCQFAACDGQAIEFIDVRDPTVSFRMLPYCGTCITEHFLNTSSRLYGALCI